MFDEAGVVSLMRLQLFSRPTPSTDARYRDLAALLLLVMLDHGAASLEFAAIVVAAELRFADGVVKNEIRDELVAHRLHHRCATQCTWWCSFLCLDMFSNTASTRRMSCTHEYRFLHDTQTKRTFGGLVWIGLAQDLTAEERIHHLVRFGLGFGPPFGG